MTKHDRTHPICNQAMACHRRADEMAKDMGVARVAVQEMRERAAKLEREHGGLAVDMMGGAQLDPTIAALAVLMLTPETVEAIKAVDPQGWKQAWAALNEVGVTDGKKG